MYIDVTVVAAGGVVTVEETPPAAPERAASFDAWVRPHLAAMANLAARMTTYDDRDDVVQEALVRAWRKWATYDEKRGAPLPWLLAITADRARRRRPNRSVELLDRAIVDNPRDVDLEQAISDLPPRQRLAVDLYYFVGLDVATTAAVMQCSTGTVKSTLSDARARLRQLLDEDQR